MVPFLQVEANEGCHCQRLSACQRLFDILFFLAAVAGGKYDSVGQEPLQPTVETISPEVSLVMTDAGN